jgi:hypothetical protein
MQMTQHGSVLLQGNTCLLHVFYMSIHILGIPIISSYTTYKSTMQHISALNCHHSVGSSSIEIQKGMSETVPWTFFMQMTQHGSVLLQGNTCLLHVFYMSIHILGIPIE